MFVEGYEIGFDYDNLYQEYDNILEYNLEIGEIIYLLGMCDSIESLWQVCCGQVNLCVGYVVE